ncbi:MAG: hypothetical protein ACD_76C00057G0003 [uncultured bacterium]|nr:MAG: hypothetical protein ACD_76C00057G0003 [uncultured bacterium]HBD05654.1 hypothetical protein [Candidatus Uhrbacteria bacterium]
MDEMEKLLRKAKKKDRERLLAAMTALRNGQIKGFKIKKISGSNFYRIRIGDFRIIFSIDETKKTIIIESVRLRDEGTYKNL